MPYISSKVLKQMLEERNTAQAREMAALRNELRTVRAERDELKEQHAARWSELTMLHRIFDKLLLRLEKYEGVDAVNAPEQPDRDHPSRATDAPDKDVCHCGHHKISHVAHPIRRCIQPGCDCGGFAAAPEIYADHPDRDARTDCVAAESEGEK